MNDNGFLKLLNCGEARGDFSLFLYVLLTAIRYSCWNLDSCAQFTVSRGHERDRRMMLDSGILLDS
jgi:hypothetical protein